MKLIIKENKEIRLNRFIEWIIYMIIYTIVFIFITSFFDSIYIDSNHLIFYSFLIEVIIYILNNTIKPILVKLTIPITGITLGLFYPFINLFILKLTDWIMGPHFELKNFWIALFFSILMAFTSWLAREIIKSIIKKVKKKL